MKDELKIISYLIYKPVYESLKGILAMPTTIRILDEDENCEEEYGFLSGLCVFPGIGIFIGSSIGLMAYYNGNDISGKNALMLSIPLATNLASGAYELWRYAHNKANASATAPGSSASSSGLEKKVEEAKLEVKPEIKPKPLEIIDPWKVDIDELESIAYSHSQEN